MSPRAHLKAHTPSPKHSRPLLIPPHTPAFALGGLRCAEYTLRPRPTSSLAPPPCLAQPTPRRQPRAGPGSSALCSGHTHTHTRASRRRGPTTLCEEPLVLQLAPWYAHTPVSAHLPCCGATCPWEGGCASTFAARRKHALARCPHNHQIPLHIEPSIPRASYAFSSTASPARAPRAPPTGVRGRPARPAKAVARRRVSRPIIVSAWGRSTQGPSKAATGRLGALRGRVWHLEVVSGA
jgi:hypothetical protein